MKNSENLFLFHENYVFSFEVTHSPAFPRYLKDTEPKLQPLAVRAPMEHEELATWESGVFWLVWFDVFFRLSV